MKNFIKKSFNRGSTSKQKEVQDHNVSKSSPSGTSKKSFMSNLWRFGTSQTDYGKGDYGKGDGSPVANVDSPPQSAQGADIQPESSNRQVLEQSNTATNSFEHMFTTKWEQKPGKNCFLITSERNFKDPNAKPREGAYTKFIENDIFENLIDIDKGVITGDTNYRISTDDWSLSTVVHEQVLFALKKAGKDTFDLKVWNATNVRNEKTKSVIRSLLTEEPDQRVLTFEAGTDGFNNIKDTIISKSKFDLVEKYPVTFPEKQVKRITVLLKGDDEAYDEIDIKYHYE